MMLFGGRPGAPEIPSVVNLFCGGFPAKTRLWKLSPERVPGEKLRSAEAGSAALVFAPYVRP